jgi:hypothetical protein
MNIWKGENGKAKTSKLTKAVKKAVSNSLVLGVRKLLVATSVHHARDSLLPSSSTGSNVEISMTSLDRDAIQPHIVA